MNTKVCTKCGIEYPATSEYFHRRKEAKDGLRIDCKKCNCESAKIRGEKDRAKNKDVYRERKRKWYSENKDYYQKWRDGNKEYQKEYDKNRQKEKPEYIKNKNKKYYAQNKEYLLKQTKIWYKENKESVIRQKRDYSRMKRKTDPKFRINGSIRAAIGHCLRGNKNGRRWELLVGYTLEQLVIHLEKQFQEGMTFENYGDWHIDHKRPISSFNFTTPEDKEFKQCWALENLQPLWKEDNLRKNNKWEEI